MPEIRVCASPCWDAAATESFFWFIRDDSDATFEGVKLVPAAGRFTSVEGQVVTLPAMRAEDYVGSDPLDLDHLPTSVGE